MDNVHKTDMHIWISDIVDLHSLLEVASEDPIKECEEDFETSMKKNFPNFNLKVFEEQCSFDKYYNPLEETVTLGKQFEIPKGVKTNLKMIQFQKEHVDKKNSDPAYEIFHYNNSKSVDYPIGKPIIPYISSPDKSDIIKLPEVLLIVQIYRPVRRKADVSGVKVQVDQEFYVFGQQFLTELLDKIDCVSDEAVIGQMSVEYLFNSMTDESCKAKELHKGGTFFIGDTFYDDCRNSEADKYGENLKKWSEGATGVGPFNHKKMEECKFIDMTKLRLGYPYVYIHQGHCEHLLVFTEARLMTKDDCLNRRCYPLRTKAIPKKNVFCMACHKITAKWVVRGNPDLPEDPFLFCNECFEGFNCDEKGDILEPYKKSTAVKFPDRAQIF